MADNVTVDNGSLTDYTVSADEGAGGQVQRVKLAYSADGSEVHVGADADGLLVNLGTNNDVTVTGEVELGATSLAALENTTVTVSGVSTAANQSTEQGLYGALTETAPATDTASSGLNGRLQRIAQRLTSLIALLPTSLGQKTSANSLAVTISSDQSAVPITLDAAALAALETIQIGTIAAGDNNIGNVDVVTMPAITVTGVSTLAEQQSQTTHLSTIAMAVGTLDNAIAGNEMQVDVLTMPAVTVTGVSTLAEQQTQTTHLATIAGDTTDIETAVELIDDAIIADDAAFTPAVTKVMMAGFEFDDSSPDSVNEGDAGAARMSANRNQYMTLRDAAGNERGANVSAGNALLVDGSATTQPISGAVTNTVLSVVGGGAQATAQRVTLSDESLAALESLTTVSTVTTVTTLTGTTTLTPGTGATNLGKAVDTAIGATDTVVAAGAVRDDALSTLTPADGDYVNIRTSSTGALWVAPVDGVVPLAGASNLGKAVDAVAGAGDTGVAILAVRDDSLTTLTPADGDYVQLRTDASGALHVNAGAGAAQYSEDAAHASGDAGDFVLAIRTDTPASSAATTGDYAGFSTDVNGRLWVASAAPTGTISSVNDTGSNVTLLAANASRRGASFYNNSTQILYLKWAATASTTSFTTKVQPDQLYELPGPTVYTGIVDGIWAADGSGACLVTELT